MLFWTDWWASGRYYLRKMRLKVAVLFRDRCHSKYLNKLVLVGSQSLYHSAAAAADSWLNSCHSTFHKRCSDVTPEPMTAELKLRYERSI